jgi:hypothetical protein
MSFPWQKMTIDEFAAFERSQGAKIASIDGVYWRQVRPFFYRPLLATQEYVPRAVSAPPLALFGGFQHALASSEKANSLLNILMFEDIRNYSIDSLERHKRKQVRSAARYFVVRPIVDVNEFKEKAFPVYSSFYQRTQYQYKAERRERDYFCLWAQGLFSFPKVAVVGAYQEGQLVAVSISQWVEDTIVYSMVFCAAEALRLNVTSFLLHLLREAAANSEQVKRISVGMYKYRGRTGVDEFYFTRGCSLVRKPAFLSINPAMKVILKSSLPRQYAMLLGRIDDLATESGANDACCIEEQAAALIPTAHSKMGVSENPARGEACNDN